jgi:hypothetical protein
MQEKNRLNLSKFVIIFFGILIPSFIFLGLLKGPIYSATSDTVNLQGKIVRNDPGYEGLNVTAGNPSCVVTGAGNDTCDFRIRYYDSSTAGNLLLTEQFSNIEIGQYLGVFNLSLGSDPAPVAGVYSSFSALIQGEDSVYVEVGFDPTGFNTYTEVFTRMPLEAAAYAVRAKYADNATGATELPWSGLKDPTADLILQHSTRKTLFNWATDTGTDDLFSLTSDPSATGTGALMNIQTGVGSALVPLRVRSGSTEAIYVNSSGKVGIGTTSPSALLEVGTPSSGSTVRFSNPASGNPTMMLGRVTGQPSIKATSASDWVIIDGGQVGLNYWQSSNVILANGGGNVGIGTANPSYKLDVSGGLRTSGEMITTSANAYRMIYGNYGSFWRFDGSALYLMFTASGNQYGTWNSLRPIVVNATTGYVTFGNGHGDLAETYHIKGTAFRGSIVSVSTTAEKMVEAASSSSPSLVGVVSTQPGAVMNLKGGFEMGHDTKPVYNDETGAIALTGIVPTLVTTENGDIETGDPIGMSLTPGYGSKMIQAGPSVGKALEKLSPTASCSEIPSIEQIVWPEDNGENMLKPCFKLPDGTIVGKILVSVHVSWYDPKPGELLERIEGIEAQLDALNTEGASMLSIESNIVAAVNNTYDIGTNEKRWKDIYAQGTINLGNSTDNGGIKYDTETKRLTFTNDGQNWIPLGSSKKSILLSVQYPGSVILDNPDVKGTMTTNSTGIDNNSMNYYEWVSSKPDLNTNKIKIRYQIPSDFKQWGDGGITFKYATESTNAQENKLDLYVYDQASNVPETISLNHVSSVEEKWESVEVLGLPFNKCSTPEDVCIFVIEMSSSKDYYTRVGDIEIKYERNL